MSWYDLGRVVWKDDSSTTLLVGNEISWNLVGTYFIARTSLFDTTSSLMKPPYLMEYPYLMETPY